MPELPSAMGSIIPPKSLTTDLNELGNTCTQRRNISKILVENHVEEVFAKSDLPLTKKYLMIFINLLPFQASGTFIPMCARH